MNRGTVTGEPQKPRTRVKAHAPWWGKGEPPHEQWPGVSLTFDATWSSARDRWETHGGKYYFDTEAADRAERFFPLFLLHHMGEFAGEPFELRADQAKLLTRPIFGWKRSVDGLRRIRKVFAFCPKGWGKALALDTPIPTPTGWTTMGAVQVGDEVLGEDGRPLRVTATTDVMHGHECYRVTFADSSQIVADADHLWLTDHLDAHRERIRAVRTTARMAARPGVYTVPVSVRLREKLGGLMHHQIVGIAHVASVPVRCITVDSSTGLYLAGESMVMTHNSPWGAGTGIYLARYDQEPAAEVYAVAGDTKQARIVFENAKIMVEMSPDISQGCEVLRDSIIWAETRSGYYVISSDASTKHGFRPHAVIFDEMHAQKNRDLFEALSRSMPKRRQPLMIIITHAGSDDEGIAFEEYDLAKRVLTGNVDLETVLPVLFEGQPGEDWQSEAVWRRVNPGHGTTVKHEAILEEAREAAVEPRKRNDFLRYHLNMWTSQATAWIPIEWWDACESVLSDDLLVTLECGAGLDLAQKWDLAAFVVVFRRYLASAAPPLQVVGEDDLGGIVKKTIDLNYEIWVRPYFWIPEDTMKQHEKEDGISYSTYRDAGLITVTEGSTIDYSRIYADITTQIVPRYPKLKQGTICYDPAFATDLATKLDKPGGLRVVELQQNYRMLSEPSQIVEALIKGRRVHHDGHRVLRWNWSNAAVKTDDAGRIRPVKPRNPAKRIDGVVAMIMGDRAVSLNEPSEKPFSMFFVGGPREVQRT